MDSVSKMPHELVVASGSGLREGDIGPILHQVDDRCLLPESKGP